MKNATGVIANRTPAGEFLPAIPIRTAEIDEKTISLLAELFFEKFKEVEIDDCD